MSAGNRGRGRGRARFTGRGSISSSISSSSSVRPAVNRTDDDEENDYRRVYRELMQDLGGRGRRRCPARGRRQVNETTDVFGTISHQLNTLISLRHTPDPDNYPMRHFRNAYVSEYLHHIGKGDGEGFNGLFMDIERRSLFFGQFRFTSLNWDECRDCGALVLPLEILGGVCCRRGTRILHRMDWPAFSPEYKEALRKGRQLLGSHWASDCMSINAVYCTARVHVSTIAPPTGAERQQNAYGIRAPRRLTDRTGIHVYQEGNVQCGGRTQIIEHSYKPNCFSVVGGQPSRHSATHPINARPHLYLDACRVIAEAIRDERRRLLLEYEQHLIDTGLYEYLWPDIALLSPLFECYKVEETFVENRDTRESIPEYKVEYRDARVEGLHEAHLLSTNTVLGRDTAPLHQAVVGGPMLNSVRQRQVDALESGRETQRARNVRQGRRRIVTHGGSAGYGGSMLNMCRRYDPALFPMLFPGGFGGYFRNPSVPSGTGIQAGVLCINHEGRYSGRGQRETHKVETASSVAKYGIYQHLWDLVEIPRPTELYILDSGSRADAIRIEQQLKDVNIQRRYVAAIKAVRNKLLQIRRSPGRNQTLREVTRPVIIPPSVTGSPGYLKLKMDDSMAIIATYGDPTLFITMTTNAKWPEITDALETQLGVGGDKAEAHPIITVRVFRAYLALLERLLREGVLFGVKPAYMLRCIEFQNRGFSHAHIIVRLDTENQPMSHSSVGHYVSARLFHADWCPSSKPKEDASCECVAHELYRIVKKFMIHTCKVGPGLCKPTAETPCKKRFPFAVSDTNYLNPDNGRWYYQRTEEDRYVVPYNPFMLFLFRCHLNVDVCTGPGSCAYLRKYQLKSGDWTVVRLQAATPEMLDQFLDDPRQEKIMEFIRRELEDWWAAKLTSSSEATTKILEIDVHIGEPGTTRITIHFPDGVNVQVNTEDGTTQTTTLDDMAVDDFDDALDESIQPTSRICSRLLRYFNRPLGPEFDNLTITQYFSRYRIRDDLTDAKIRNLPQNSYTLDQGIRRPRSKPLPVQRRRNERHCGYLARIPPSQVEKYCLRQLLAKFPARSYDDLKFGYQTYAAAAEAHDLYKCQEEERFVMQYIINSQLMNSQWDEAHEAKQLVVFEATDWRIVRMFVILATSTGDRSETGVVRQLFDKFFPYMIRNPRVDAFEVPSERQRALRVVVEHLYPLRLELEDIGLESTGDPPLTLESMIHLERRRVEAESSTTPPAVELTREQATWVEDVLGVVKHYNDDRHQREYGIIPTAVDGEVIDEREEEGEEGEDQGEERRSNVFFLAGNAGTGKSTALRALLDKVRDEGNMIALPAAFMACAASLLPGGDTLHRLFKVQIEEVVDHNISGAPVDHTRPLQSNLKRSSKVADLLRKTSLLIIDEISMVSRRLLECVDTTMREITNCRHLPFGGCVVVFAGDFKQLTPVIPGADRRTTIAESAVSTQVFRDIPMRNHTLLRHQLRNSNPTWNAFALAAGYGVSGYVRCTMCGSNSVSGDACSVCTGVGFIPIVQHQKNGDYNLPLNEDGTVQNMPTNIKLNTTTSLNEAMEFAFGNPNAEPGFIVSSINHDVSVTNDAFTDDYRPRVATVHPLQAVNMQSDADYSHGMRILPENMEKCTAHGIPPNELRLWVGARVTLLRNVHTPSKLFNGQRLIVTNVSKFVVHAFIESDPQRREIQIPRFTFSAHMSSAKFERKQFPLKLAYGFTVNRSQGQTIHSNVVVDCRRPYFLHGQLYVSITRVCDPRQLLFLMDPNSPGVPAIVLQALLTKSNDTLRTFIRLQDANTGGQHITTEVQETEVEEEGAYRSVGLQDEFLDPYIHYDECVF